MPALTLAKITVTGKTGPGLTETSQVYNNVTKLTFDYIVGILFIEYGYPNVVRAEVDLFDIATLSYTIGTHAATVVAST